MNIAIFTHNYPKDEHDRKDAGIFIHDFAEELRKHKKDGTNKVFVFCPEYGNKEKFGNWSVFNPLNILRLFRNLNFGTKEAFKFVEKNKIDYVLSAWAIPSGVYAFLVKMKYKIPYSVWFLGSDLNIFSRLPVLNICVYLVAKYADTLFANSYSLCKIAETKYGNCTMLPASTRLNELKNGDKRKKRSGSQIDEILFVGRLEKIKGPDILLEAFSKLDANKYRLTIIGDGTLKEKLQNGSKNVNFLGYRGLEEISKYMRESDFLIVPSRNESLPLVILEAANYNLPVLASDVGDCRLVIEKYRIGRIFDKENTDQLRRMINKFNFKKIRSYGRFSDLVVDYNLDSSVEKFLDNIKYK